MHGPRLQLAPTRVNAAELSVAPFNVPISYWSFGMTVNAGSCLALQHK